MSWASFIDSLTADGAVTSGAIVGLDGGIWAQSANLKMTAAEVKVLIAGFSDSKNLTGGIHVGGVKYMYLRSSEDSIVSKKGSSGCVCSKAGKCFVVGIYGSDSNISAANMAVSKMSDYLTSSGF